MKMRIRGREKRRDWDKEEKEEEERREESMEAACSKD